MYKNSKLFRLTNSLRKIIGYDLSFPFYKCHIKACQMFNKADTIQLLQIFFILRICYLIMQFKYLTIDNIFMSNIKGLIND